MCSLLSGRDKSPLAMCSFKWVPHPCFDVSVKICRAYFSWWLGLMVDLWLHCLPPATIWDVGGMTWVWGSPFLIPFLVPSSCFWDVTVWVSCVTSLSAFAFLWLSINPLGALVSRQHTPDRSWDLFFFVCRVCQHCWVGLTLLHVELITYEVENLFWVQFWFVFVHLPSQFLTESYQHLCTLETGLVGSWSDQPVV